MNRKTIGNIIEKIGMGLAFSVSALFAIYLIGIANYAFLEAVFFSPRLYDYEDKLGFTVIVLLIDGIILWGCGWIIKNAEYSEFPNCISNRQDPNQKVSKE